MFYQIRLGAPGRIRTCGTRFRKPLLYPLSYEGWALIQSLAETAKRTGRTMTIARVLRWPRFVLPLEPVTPPVLPCLPRVPVSASASP